MLKQIPTLDVFSWQPPVISILDTPPAGEKGDRYIVGEGTDDWLGEDNNIAWYDSGWNFTIASDGMTVFNMATNSFLTFDIETDSWLDKSDAGAGGLDTQVQFNDNGDLAGDDFFTWDKDNKRLSITAPGYVMTAAPLVHNGTDYDYIEGGNGAYFLNTTNAGGGLGGLDTTPITTTEHVIANGTSDINVCCLTLNSVPANYATIYFLETLFSTQQDLQDWFDSFTDPGDVTIDYFGTGIFAANGAGQDYGWNNPDSKVIVSGFTTPPTLEYDESNPYMISFNQGRVEMDVSTEPVNDTGLGYTYMKADGKLYFKALDNTEYDLTQGTTAETDPVFTSWLATPPNVSIFTNDAGYLTVETDPVYSASSWFTTTNNSTDWDTAYGWGDHAGLYDLVGAGASAVAGHELAYDHTLIATALQSETDPLFSQWLIDTPPLYSETDPVFSAWLLATPPLYSETDPVYSASSWFTTTNNSANWDSAYGWGNHADAGYLTEETDPLSLHLDQTTPQTVANGLPTFSSGIISPYIYGSNASGGDILLSSTSDATKGDFNIQVRDGNSILGSELITNGDFTGSATGWTLGAGWAYGTNNVIHTAGTASALEPSTPVSLEDDKAYYFKITVGIYAGNISIRQGTTVLKTLSRIDDLGLMSQYTVIKVMTSPGNFNLYASSDFDGTVDYISVKEVSSAPSFSVYTTSPESNGSIDFRISAGNLSIGTNAGRYMYGNSNTNLGYQSGYGLDGYYNTNLGYQSGYGLDGNSNINLGYYSGRGLDGNYNTNIGNYSGYGLDGNSNTNLGIYSGYGLDGNSNTNLGYYSGDSLDGNYNTNIGHQSGRELIGDSNIFIGYNARFDTSMTVSNKLFIDVEQTDTPLIYGEFDNDLIRINGDLNVTDDLTVNDTVLVGTDANFTDFPNAKMIISKGDTGYISSSPIGFVAEGARVGMVGIGLVTGTSSSDSHGTEGVAKVDTGVTGQARGGYFISTDTHEGGNNVGVWTKASGGTVNYGVFSYGTEYSFYGDEGKIYNEDQLLIGSTASLTDFANTKGIISLSNTGKSNAERNALVLETTITGSTSANGIYVAVGVEDSADTGVARAGQFLSNSTHDGNNYAIYADADNGVSNFSFYGIHGQFYNAEGIRTKISNANVSNPPTDAQLDSAFGDPTTKGTGWIGVLDDAGAGTNVYFVYTTGNAGEWYYVAGTRAT